jgi:hypothetical protein
MVGFVVHKTGAKTKTVFARRSHFGFNARKRQTLEILENRGWLSPPAWAVLAGVYPTRAAYSYLLRLHRWGLLERRRDARGLILYRLSAKGAHRLAWLRRKG